RADVEVVRVRAVVEVVAVLRAPDVDEPRRLGNARQRPEQHRAGDGEDRGVGADADGERQRGRELEQRAAAQQPVPVTYILPGGLDHARLPRSWSIRNSTPLG